MFTTISRKETVWAFAFTLARTVFCGHRAATQSIAHDEAFAYFRYLQGPWSDIWTPLFDAANHVLYTFLAKFSITILGPSEFGLRFPSVIAGFFMMLGVWRVLESFGKRPVPMWSRWLGFIAFGLHPLLLDFSVAARGYGLSVTFLVWAIHAIQINKPRRAGFLLGLGIASNLTIAIPAIALSITAALLNKRFREAVEIGGIAAATALVICAYPMRGAHMSHFYAGVPNAYESLVNLIYNSTYSVGAPNGLFGSGAAAFWISKWIVPPLALAFAWWTIRTRDLVAIVVALSLAGIAATHFLFGSPYPIDRTGLYLMALATLALARLGPAFAVVLALLVAQFVTQIQVETLRVWAYSSDSKQIALRLKDECQGKDPMSIRVATYFVDQPSLEYYRQRLPVACAQPFERLTDPYLPGYDYYVVSTTAPPAPEGLGEKIFAGPFWGPSLIRKATTTPPQSQAAP